MSAAVVLLLSQQRQLTQRSSDAAPVHQPDAPKKIAPEGGGGPDLRGSSFSGRPYAYLSPSASWAADRDSKQTASTLAGKLAADESLKSASALSGEISTAALNSSARLGVSSGDLERQLVRNVIGKLINPCGHFASAKSLLLAGKVLWARAAELGLEIHPQWESQFKHKLGKVIATAINTGNDPMGDNRRAFYALKDGSALFTELHERSWSSSPLILAGAAFARLIGGTPVFSVADALLRKDGAEAR